MKISTIKNILSINPWLTLRFNLHYFPLEHALRFPILVSYRTKVAMLGGKVILRDIQPCFGLLKLGFQAIGFQDGYYDRTVWQVAGNVTVKGHVNIGRGCKICVVGGGDLTLGNGLTINGSSNIVCAKSVTLGNNVLMSWGCTIMDTDFHCIWDKGGKKVNEDQEIIIDDNTWIGMNSTILKGCKIPSNCVIAAGSILSKVLAKEGCIYGSHGQVIKEDIFWTWH